MAGLAMHPVVDQRSGEEEEKREGEDVAKG